MQNAQVNINFERMGLALQEYVRSKALVAGSNLVYLENDQIIKENPRTGQKTVIKNTAENNK